MALCLNAWSPVIWLAQIEKYLLSLEQQDSTAVNADFLSISALHAHSFSLSSFIGSIDSHLMTESVQVWVSKVFVIDQHTWAGRARACVFVSSWGIQCPAACLPVGAPNYPGRWNVWRTIRSTQTWAMTPVHTCSTSVTERCPMVSSSGCCGPLIKDLDHSYTSGDQPSGPTLLEPTCSFMS